MAIIFLVAFDLSSLLFAPAPVLRSDSAKNVSWGILARCWWLDPDG